MKLSHISRLNAKWNTLAWRCTGSQHIKTGKICGNVQRQGSLNAGKQSRQIHVSPCLRYFDEMNPKLVSISPFNMEETWDIHEFRDEYIENGLSKKVPLLCENNEIEYCIVGGGIMGSSLAFNLWKVVEKITPRKASKYMAVNVVIFERDPTMSRSSTVLSVGSIRQQFSYPQNIKLSMQSAEFIKNIKTHLEILNEDLPDIQFTPQGYLFLASGKGVDTLMENYNTQVEEGAKVMIMDRTKLKETFPWLNVDDIEMASYGLENEGWFDPWAYLNAFKKKLPSLGVQYIHGEVVGFKKQQLHYSGEVQVCNEETGEIVELDDQLVGVYVKTPTCDRPIFIKCANIFNCAGPWAGELSDNLGIGTDCKDVHYSLSKRLPVRPEKRTVYAFHCPDGPLFDCPMVIDPSGLYFRREGTGGMYICGMPPPDPDSVDNSNLDVDYDFFHEVIWPKLAERVPVFEKLKLKSAWAGYYDYNTWDQNAIIGDHSYYKNFWFLNGFSGHGIQMAYAASNAVAKMVVRQKSEITREHFPFKRIVDGTRIAEKNII